jgi:hypothetical protein
MLEDARETSSDRGVPKGDHHRERCRSLYVSSAVRTATVFLPILRLTHVPPPHLVQPTGCLHPPVGFGDVL